jgi:alanine dehydrogenase
MRVLSNADIEQVLTPAECLSALETAYVELAQGKGANRPRNHTYFPVEDPRHPGFRFRFKSQEGGTVSGGVWALRITSDIAGVETLANGVQRRRLIPAAPGGRYVGLVTLYSMTTLEPLAILHDSVVQKMRVGATSALGIRELAATDVTVAGMFGSGWQAESHLECLLMVRPEIEEVRVYSPTPGNREKFAATWSERTGKRIVAVTPASRGPGWSRAASSRRSPRRTAPPPVVSWTTRRSTAPTASSCSPASRCTTTSSTTSSARSTVAG